MNFFRVHTKKSKQSLNINIPCILCIAAIVIAASGLAIYRRHISDDNNLHDSLEHFFEWEVYSIKEESWWCTSECQELADKIIKCQKIDGGWTKDMHTTAAGVWSMSTIDNNATWGQVRFLAKCFSANGNNEYKSACIRGIECMLEMQYENGGWPQIADTEGDYHAHITFNDNAMTEVMETLKMISDRSEQDGFSWVDDELACSSSEAFEEGLDCILKCQIMVDGRLTAWCQQYDEKTLEPAGGRDYELPSICTKESTGIVRLLQTIPDRTPEIETSIQSAIAWFDVWAVR